MRKLIVGILLAVGFTVGVQVNSASAYLTQCSASATGISSGQSICWNHANTGGSNQQQFKYRCITPDRKFGTGYFFGHVAGQGQVSSGQCYDKHDNLGHSTTTMFDFTYILL